jgi:pimeloyl-ACP methyl ester carboxylesterase
MFAHEAGSGTPIVLLHGFGMDHRSLLPLESTFERSGLWRRIYLDLPGATRTPVGDITRSRHASATSRSPSSATPSAA